jgi:hypothetical protein
MAPLEIKPYSELDKPLRFEMVLAEISTLFINLPADRIDSEIEAVQRRVCELLDLDRSALWQVLEGEPGKLKLSHLYQPTEILQPSEQMNAKTFFPWTEQKVLGGETVTISKLTDLPPEAEIDLENYRLYGTKSNVLVPLSVGGGSLGHGRFPGFLRPRNLGGEFATRPGEPIGQRRFGLMAAVGAYRRLCPVCLAAHIPDGVERTRHACFVPVRGGHGHAHLSDHLRPEQPSSGGVRSSWRLPAGAGGSSPNTRSRWILPWGSSACC